MRLIIISILILIPLLVFSENYVPQNIWGGDVKRVVEAPSSPGTFYAV